MTRSRWHTLTTSLVLGWIAAAGVVAALHRQIPAAPWLMVHLLMLGGVTTAILVWSWHFALALTRSPAPPSRRAEAARLAAANLGIVLVVGGVASDAAAVVSVGAGLLGAAVIAHVIAIVRRLRGSLPSRFAVTVRAYAAAGVFLLIGVAIGVLLVRGTWSDDTYASLVLGHVTVNLLGWIGLPILSTVVTLWPTMLRTRMNSDAERLARRALPYLVGGTLLAVGGAVAGIWALSVVGIAAYLVGVGLTLWPMLLTARSQPPQSFASWSTLAGVLWLTGSLVAFGVHQVSGGLMAGAPLAAAALVGGVVQVLLGALSYLAPTMAGGGPAAVRARFHRVDAMTPVRLVIVNVALMLAVVTSVSVLRVIASVLILVMVAWTAVLILMALRPVRVGRAATPAETMRLGGVVVGAGVLLISVAAAVAVDPPAVGLAATPSPQVQSTGETTIATVTMRGMRFVPDTIEVPAGNALVITVVNEGDDVHDLVLDNGLRTPRLAPGESAVLEVEVVGRTTEGWCSVAGHRQMGMVFTIEAVGGQPPVAAAEHSHAGDDDPGATFDAPDLMAPMGPGVEPYDARLRPASTSTVHRVRLVVSESEQEVAPGVRQTRWTFGGSVPGPPLRGRVGDTFIITLVNDGTIGHSIDFHAGALAPDGPMRTIGPGEELEYRFTATRAGVWMYHCSTMPMSMHIANGMFGAVVIDPPDMPAVDHEFLLVQSESYLGSEGGTADAEAISSGEYDLVSFNGYPMQYDHHPIQVGVGDRVRVWLLAAGPNVGSSFHVVGAQFDTVFREGAYDLRPGSGGSQALGLFPAQGGFVEFTLPEAGSYPFVTHVMSDAEKGAHGLFVADVPDPATPRSPGS